MELTLTEQAQETFDSSVAHLVDRLERSPRSYVPHAEAARAFKHLGESQWNDHRLRAIELLVDDLAHPRPPGDLLMIARCLQWVDQPERAVPYLEQIVAWTATELDRRPERRIDFDYFVALVLLGELDRVVEMSQRPNASGGKLLPALVGVIEADRASDRRARDDFARQIVALHNYDYNQSLWYSALDAQMTTKKRFGRSGQLPTHPPAPKAVADHASYTIAFGPDAVATQIRAAQIGKPIMVDVLQGHIVELESVAASPVLPGPHQLFSLAALHRLGNDNEASDQVLQQLLHQGNTDANDQAIAWMLLGDHEELLASATGPDRHDLHDAVVAYASIAQGETHPALDDLTRWASKQAPVELGVPVWFAEVISLARSRFSL